MTHPEIHRDRERGGALIVSLIFLVILALFGLSSMSTSRLELRMANNDEARTASYQAAQALVDAIVASQAMTPVMSPGFTVCTPGIAPCDEPILAMPAGDLEPEVADGKLTAVAVMDEPTAGLPPRWLDGFSVIEWGATGYDVSVTYDRADEGRGQATVNQGILILTKKM